MSHFEAGVFLSYAREDQARVEELYSNLNAGGFRAWMDRHDIPPGSDWNECIGNAIRSSDFFLACISQRSLVKGGVLAREIETALALWRRKAKHGRLRRFFRSDQYLIPVRLEECPIPEQLAHLQWVDLFQDQGWREVSTRMHEASRTVARRTALALGAGAMATGAVAGPWVLGHLRFRSVLGEMRGPGGAGEFVRIGVTLWRLRTPKPSDPSGAKVFTHGGDLTAIRTESHSVRVGDRVRVGIECSVSGYLYVFGQEKSSTGEFRQPTILFPTASQWSGNNHIPPNRLVELPSRSDDPPYYDVRALGDDYRGELLTILLSRDRLADFRIPDRSAMLPVEMLQGWLQLSETGFQRVASWSLSGEPQSDSEAQARAGVPGSAHLRRGDPAPQVIYSAPVPEGRPALVRHLVEVIS